MNVNKISLNTIMLNHVGLNLIGVSPSKKREQTPTYLSCFGNGVWEDEGLWFNTDTWKSEIQYQPFLTTGLWNNEGIYRFKDKFKFESSVTTEFKNNSLYKTKIKTQSKRSIRR